MMSAPEDRYIGTNNFNRPDIKHWLKGLPSQFEETATRWPLGTRFLYRAAICDVWVIGWYEEKDSAEIFLVATWLSPDQVDQTTIDPTRTEDQRYIFKVPLNEAALPTLNDFHGWGKA